MNDIVQYIDGIEKLTDIFGDWPSFHDAEILEFNLCCDKFVPVLIVNVHHWETTNEVDASGCFILRNHMLTTFRFHAIKQLEMDGFNSQNVISELLIEKQSDDGTSATFYVEFAPLYGLGASFVCSRIDVLDSIPHVAAE